ncbi:MAG: hypothetical protein ACRESZ_05925 [Methylococcales bacterium]
MKKWTLFTALLMLFALVIVLPERGLPAESPRFEQASLKRDFVSTDPRYWYIFDFDFVNALSQPIEVISVNVYDMNRQRVEQDWAMGGPNFDPRLMTHALSGSHPLAKIISKPRGTPLEEATISSVGDRAEIRVTNRILSAGQGLRPSMYILDSKNKYDSLILQVVYKVNGNQQQVTRTFTVGMREEDKPPSVWTWPFDPSKDQWAIINGYRGALDHAPGGSLNNYALFAFDFAKCAKIDLQTTGLCDLSGGWAKTTGAMALSPVSGTIKWTDSRCAGLSIEIDGAPGYHVAIFHLDGYPSSGHLSQGKPIGTVSDTACKKEWSGNHIHMVLYYQAQKTDSPDTRAATPFSDPWGIGGCNYSDDGKTPQQHLGRLVPCSTTR